MHIEIQIAGTEHSAAFHRVLKIPVKSEKSVQDIRGIPFEMMIDIRKHGIGIRAYFRDVVFGCGVFESLCKFFDAREASAGEFRHIFRSEVSTEEHLP